MGKLVKLGSTYYKIKLLAFLIGYQFFTIHQGTLPIFWTWSLWFAFKASHFPNWNVRLTSLISTTPIIFIERWLSSLRMVAQSRAPKFWKHDSAAYLLSYHRTRHCWAFFKWITISRQLEITSNTKSTRCWKLSRSPTAAICEECLITEKRGRNSEMRSRCHSAPIERLMNFRVWCCSNKEISREQQKLADK